MQRYNMTKNGICLIQMKVVKNKEDNIKTAVRLIRNAVQIHKVKLVVLPETFTTFYGKDYFKDHAEIIPTGLTCTTFMNLCRELKIYLVCGSIIELDDKDKFLYNTTMVISPMGELLTKYRKMHLSHFEIDNDCHVREMDYLKYGKNLCTFDYDGIKVGLCIGFDLSFPELATLYRHKGCDILICPAMFPDHIGRTMWHNWCRTRAIDNQMFVVGVSTVYDDLHDFVTYGHSVVVDPRGKMILRGHDYEDVLYCDLDFDHMDKWRKNFKLMDHKRKDIYDVVLHH